MVLEAAETVLERPRLRGVLHQWAFAVFTGASITLIVVAPTQRARLAAVIYAITISGLFGVSALYHRVMWSPRARSIMQRIDHSMIFVFIAGSYTPFCLLVARGRGATAVLITVWVGAAVGVLFGTAWPGAPRWLVAPSYLALGWVAVALMPQVLHHGGVATLVLLALGGALYSVGAFVYALQRPNPSPAVFGYHEVFHALTVVAAACHFIAIAAFALPSNPL